MTPESSKAADMYRKNSTDGWDNVGKLNAASGPSFYFSLAAAQDDHPAAHIRCRATRIRCNLLQTKPTARPPFCPQVSRRRAVRALSSTCRQR